MSEKEVVDIENQIKEEIVETKNGRVYSLTAGSGDTTLLYLHGISSSPWPIQYLASFFVPKGLEIVAPYLPGQGPSFVPEKGYKLSDLVNTMQEFIVKKNLHNIILIGHSLGGGVALRIAAEKNNEIKALILHEPMLVPIPKIKSRAITGALPDYVRDKTESIISAGEYQINPEYKYRVKSSNPVNYLKLLPLLSEKTRDLKEGELGNLPVLYLWGNKSRTLPFNEFPEWARKVSQYVEIEEVGGRHNWHMVSPGKYLKTVGDFLERTGLI